MTKFCIFPTFAEAKEAQYYDHLHQKAVSFATVSGIDLEIIKQNNLHIQSENGFVALDQYIAANNIALDFPELYEQTKKYWINTTDWAVIYKYNNQFVYLKDHSDLDRNIIELNIQDLIQIDENGNEIEAIA